MRPSRRGPRMRQNGDQELEKDYSEQSMKFTKHLNCSVCMQIYLDPVYLGCGHTFCEGCIKKWKNPTCPECRNPFDRGQIKPDLLARDIVQDLKVKCLNKHCGWVGHSHRLKDHLLVCDFSKQQIQKQTQMQIELDDKMIEEMAEAEFQEFMKTKDIENFNIDEQLEKAAERQKQQEQEHQKALRKMKKQNYNKSEISPELKQLKRKDILNYPKNTQPFKIIEQQIQGQFNELMLSKINQKPSNKQLSQVLMMRKIIAQCYNPQKNQTPSIEKIQKYFEQIFEVQTPRIEQYDGQLKQCMKMTSCIESTVRSEIPNGHFINSNVFNLGMGLGEICLRTLEKLNSMNTSQEERVQQLAKAIKNGGAYIPLQKIEGWILETISNHDDLFNIYLADKDMTLDELEKNYQKQIEAAKKNAVA